MAKPYKQLSFIERKRIEEALDIGYSFRRIAEELGRSPSTISHEVYENRMRKRIKVINKRHCAKRRICDIKGLCGEGCPYKGHELCSECIHTSCMDVCKRYERLSYCERLNSAPWVCNGCKRRGICRAHKPEQWLYLADAADTAARARRSEARRGFDMDAEEAERIFNIIHDHLKRGLSPYEISIACADSANKSRSTIYRWVDEGFGDMCNLELERKVGFRKRKKHPRKAPTRHTSKRSYDELLRIDEEVRLTRIEMDTVLGKKGDDKCILTLYHVPTKFQLALLLQEKTQEEVLCALKMVRRACSQKLFDHLFGLVLTDNGAEFADEYRLSRALGEKRGSALRLYYCDIRASNQKGSCEKNHTELRQIIPKGSISFDELRERDMSVLMSHANSNPRAALCGASPISMFKAMFGEDGEGLLDALGVEEVPYDKLTLKPWILNAERDRRGEEMLQMQI